MKKPDINNYRFRVFDHTWDIVRSAIATVACQPGNAVYDMTVNDVEKLSDAIYKEIISNKIKFIHDKETTQSEAC